MLIFPKIDVFSKKLFFSGINFSIFFLANGFPEIFFYSQFTIYPKLKIGQYPEKIAIFDPEKSLDLEPVLRGHAHGLIFRFLNWNFFERAIHIQMNVLRT